MHEVTQPPIDVIPMNTVHKYREERSPSGTIHQEGVDTLFEEWLPMFELMAMRNSWSQPEKVLQLAGHLRSKARQEW